MNWNVKTKAWGPKFKAWNMKIECINSCLTIYFLEATNKQLQGKLFIVQKMGFFWCANLLHNWQLLPRKQKTSILVVEHTMVKCTFVRKKMWKVTNQQFWIFAPIIRNSLLYQKSKLFLDWNWNKIEHKI